MSVQRNPRWGHESRRLSTLLAIGLAVLFSLVSIGAQAQEETVVEPLQAEVVDSDFWARVTERYEVVVLSRGLLLEPLDDGVELLTIEIVDNRVAIDGRSLDENELREQIGDEAADLILELAAMESDDRRLMFEGDGVASVTMASAEEGDADDSAEDHRRYRDSQVAVGNSLTVREDEVSNEALVFGGPLYVLGKVAGDAVAVGGSVTVSGEVTGDVAAIGGDLTLEAGAEVLGDVVSVGGEVEIDDEARVRGQIIEVPFGPNLRFGAWPGLLFGGRHGGMSGDDDHELTPWRLVTDSMWNAFKLILLALFACLVMLVAREPMERVKRKAIAEPWKSGLVGLLVMILFTPLLVLVTLILVISIIGIPLVLLVPFFVLALILIAFLGYTGVAYGIGQFLKKRFGWSLESPYAVLLLGVLTIEVWSIIGDLLDFGWGPIWFFAVMFGVLGVLVKFVAWTVGLGAAVLSRFGTADHWGGRALTTNPPVPPPVPSYDEPPDPSQPRDPREPSVLRESGFSDTDGDVPSDDLDGQNSREEPPGSGDL